ncbi:hypothetical protein AVEN_275293-1, partial [Araneus ventricosus]
WEVAEVLRQNEVPRSYCIRTYNGEIRTKIRIHLRPNKYSNLAPFKNVKGYKEYSTRDTLPESTPVVRPQEQATESASDSQSNPVSSFHEDSSRCPDKGPYRIPRYGRFIKPPSRYGATF